MATLHVLLLCSVLVVSALSFSFKLISNAATCFKIQGGETYVIEYISSGKNDKNVKMELFENSQSVLLNQNQHQFFTTRHFSPGTAQICFTKTDKDQKTISLDFYQESDPVRSIIDSKEMAIVIHNLQQSIQSMKEASRNEQFHIERDEINRVILEESESRIKWSGIVKICFLLLSAFIQLWIMKSFFKHNSIPYQPVDQ